MFIFLWSQNILMRMDALARAEQTICDYKKT